MITPRCPAQVPKGVSTYALRNSSRQCKNAAANGGYCPKHQRYVITEDYKMDLDAIYAALKITVSKVDAS